MVNPVEEYRRKVFRKIGLEDFDGQVVLDIGCGDGGDVFSLEEKTKICVGIDIQPNALWFRSSSTKANFCVSDAEKIPFRNEVFDIVFEKDMLHHTPNPERALEEMKRVTKKGGKIIIIEANRYNPIFYFHMTLMLGHQHFTQARFRKLVAQVFGSSASFFSFEAHVYPVFGYFLPNMYSYCEKMLEGISCLDKILSYNTAIIKL